MPLGADNSPEWQRLFVQGVANHLMAHQSFAPPSPDVAARLEQTYRPDPFGNILAELARNRAGLGEALSEPFPDKREASRIAAHDEAVAEDAEVTSGEANWLKRLFESDGARDPMEQALLDFLAEGGERPF